MRGMKTAVMAVWGIAILSWAIKENPNIIEAQRHEVAPTLAMTYASTEPAVTVPDNTAETITTYSQTDMIDLVARVAYCEAGNQPEEGVRAVVDVILNRVESPRFRENTIEGVVFAEGQFSVVFKGTIWTVNVPEEFRAIVADEMQTTQRVLPPEYLFFNTTPIGVEPYIVIGAHIFGR